MAYTKTIFPSFSKDEATGQIIKEKVKTTIKVHPLQPIIFMESMCDEFTGVKLQDKLGNYLIKTNNKNEIDTTHFYLSNNEQKIFVDSSYMGELMTIEYYSIGGFKFSDKLVATQYDESNTVTETLNDIITKGRASIDFYNASGSAIQLQDDLEATNTVALATNTILQQSIVDGGLQTMKDDIANNETSIDNIKLTTSPHLLKYKTVSVTVRSISDKPSLADWQHLKTQGVSATMVVMVGLTSATSYAPTMMADYIINGVIADANSVGVKIDMIKLHLGTNYSDGFNRGDYLPSDVNAYFTNWQVICLHYAQMCNANNIPILCIGCEQPNQSKDVYLPKWTTIVNAIKASYPNLLLTYAGKTWEFPNNGCNAICSVLDIIGYNVYLSYTQKKLSEATPTVEQMGKAFYINYDGNKVIDTIVYLSKKYGKKVFITEIGCMPLDTGLQTNVPYGYATEVRNYDAIAWLMRASFDVLFRNQNVIGFGWWHIKEPFDYYNNTETTSAEQVMIDYVKGGLI